MELNLHKYNLPFTKMMANTNIFGPTLSESFKCKSDLLRILKHKIIDNMTFCVSAIKLRRPYSVNAYTTKITSHEKTIS